MRDSPISEAAPVFAAATARPTFVVETGEQLAASARAVLGEVTAATLATTVVGPNGLLLAADDVPDDLAVGNAAAAAVIICATFSDASMADRLVGDVDVPIILWSFREPGPQGDRLWLNSMCGANLAAHALVGKGRSVAHLHGNPEEPAVRERLATLLTGHGWEAPLPSVSMHRPLAPDDRVHAALAQLQGRRIGLIGEHPAGFTPCELDALALQKLLGVEVAQLGLEQTLADIQAADAERANAEAARTAQRTSGLAELEPSAAEGMGAVTTTLRNRAETLDLDALAVRCWPEFPTELGVCPCSSLGSLATDGLITACERDVNGAATMLLMEALGAGPTYLVDLVDLEEARDLVRIWHCGAASLALAAEDDPRVSVHCNRKIGVAGDFALKPGPVTLARLSTAGGRWQLLLAAGEAIDAPNRFQGNTADVVLDADAAATVRGLIAMGAEHHHVVAWNDIRPALRTAAKQMDLPVVELTR